MDEAFFSESMAIAAQAREEIVRLRHEVAVLRPKAEAYDTLRAFSELLPRPSQGYAPCAVHALDKHMARLRAAIAPANPQEN